MITANDVLTFRDDLQAAPATRTAHETRERNLAVAHPHDREVYTESKNDLVTELTRAAHAWRTAESGPQQGLFIAPRPV